MAQILGTELAGKTQHLVSTILGHKSWQRIWAQNLQARHNIWLTPIWARNPGKESGHRTCRQDTTLINAVLGYKYWQRIWAQNLQARHNTLLTPFWARKSWQKFMYQHMEAQRRIFMHPNCTTSPDPDPPLRTNDFVFPKPGE